MRRRAHLLVAASLPPLLLGLWALFLVLAGGAQPTAGAVVSALPGVSRGPAVSGHAGHGLSGAGTSVAGASAVPVRADGPQRAAAARPDTRRSPVTAVPQLVAADTGAHPPGAPPALAGPVPPAYRPPVPSGESAGPRQERAPPHSAYSPRHTRAPPSTRSS